MNLQQIEKDFIVIQEFEYEGKKTLYARDKNKTLPVFFEQSDEGFVFVSPNKYYELRNIFEKKVIIDHGVREIGRKFVASDTFVHSEYYTYLEGDRYFEHIKYIPEDHDKVKCEVPFVVAFEEALTTRRAMKREDKNKVIDIIKSAINRQLSEIEFSGNKKSSYLQLLRNKPIIFSLYEFNTRRYLGYCNRKDSSQIALDSSRGRLNPNVLSGTVRHEMNHSLTGENECSGVSDERGNFTAINEAMTEICSHTNNGKFLPTREISYEEYVNIVFFLGVKPHVVNEIYFSRFSPKQKLDLLVDEIVLVNKTSREMAYKVLYQMDLIFNIDEILEERKVEELDSDSLIKALRASLFEIHLAKVTAESIENFEFIQSYSARDFGLSFPPFERMNNARMEKVKSQFIKKSIENCKLKKEGIILPNGLFVYHNKMAGVCASLGIKYENHLNKRIADVESESRIRYEKEKRDSDSFDARLAKALVAANSAKDLTEMFSPDMPQSQKEQLASFLCVAMYFESQNKFFAYTKEVGEVFADTSRGIMSGGSMEANSLFAEMMKFATKTKNRNLLFDIYENFAENKNLSDKKSYFELVNLYSSIEMYKTNREDYFDIKYEILRSKGKVDRRLFPNISMSQTGAVGRFFVCPSSFRKMRDPVFLSSEVNFFNYTVSRAIESEDLSVISVIYDFAARAVEKYTDQQLFLLREAIKSSFDKNPVKTIEFLRRSGNIFLLDETFSTDIVQGELSKFLIPLLRSKILNEHLFVERKFRVGSNGVDVDAAEPRMTYLAKLLCIERNGKMEFDVQKVSKFVKLADSITTTEIERDRIKTNLLSGVQKSAKTLGFREFEIDELT